MNTISWNNVNFQKEKSLDSATQMLTESVSKVSRPIHEFERAAAEEGTKEILFQRQKETDLMIEANFNGTDYVPKGFYDHAQVTEGIKNNDMFKQQATMRNQSINLTGLKIDSAERTARVEEAVQPNRLAAAITNSESAVINAGTAKSQAQGNADVEAKFGDKLRNAEVTNALLKPEQAKANLNKTKQSTKYNAAQTWKIYQDGAWNKESHKQTRKVWARANKAADQVDNAGRVYNAAVNESVNPSRMPTNKEAVTAANTLNGSRYRTEEAKLNHMSNEYASTGTSLNAAEEERTALSKRIKAMADNTAKFNPDYKESKVYKDYQEQIKQADKKVSDLTKQYKKQQSALIEYSENIQASRVRDYAKAAETAIPRSQSPLSVGYNRLHQKAIDGESEFSHYDIFNSENSTTSSLLNLGQKQATLDKTNRMSTGKKDKSKSKGKDKDSNTVTAKDAEAARAIVQQIADNNPNVSSGSLSKVVDYLNKTHRYTKKALSKDKTLKAAMVRIYGTDNISKAAKMTAADIKKYQDSKEEEK